MSDNYPIWHPFTQMKTAGVPLKVKRAYGAHLELEDGRRIVDCISSWWVTLHGHSNAEIAESIYKQAKELEHVIFAGFTHEPAIELSRLLLKKLPGQFTRVFFSDNGSTSVEVALKMAYQYWQNVGQPQRRLFIGFDGGYHGDTFGAMSAGGSSPFWDPFRSLMFAVETVPYPSTYDGDADVSAKERASLSKLSQLLSERSDECAAIIIEPLVQGAAGMRMCRPQFLQELRRLADEHSVLLIFDEVMTGFGRTGDWFACTKAGVQPDVICLSKGITGGVLPLSVTCCTETIYEAFLSDDLSKALFHSHSYTGNPIACAAAVASWDLLGKAENIFRTMESRHRSFAEKYLVPSELFEHFRFCGTIAAFDVKTDTHEHYFSEMGPALRKRFVEAGLLLRPLGNTIYFMPPLCIDDDTLALMYGLVQQVVGEFVHNCAPATVDS